MNQVDKPRRVLCGLVVQHGESFDLIQSLAVALAKSQDHRASCGVFSFGDRPSDTRYVTGPEWAVMSENTVTKIHPLDLSNSVD